MNVDFIAGINNLGEKIYTCEPFKTSFQNPFIVALIITAVVLVVFLQFVIRRWIKNEKRRRLFTYIYAL